MPADREKDDYEELRRLVAFEAKLPPETFVEIQPRTLRAIRALLSERDELRQASIAWGRQMHTLMDERDELRQALERIADDGIERSRDPRTLIAVSEAMVKAAMDAYMNEASNVSYAGIRAALVAAMEVRHG